MNFFSFNMIKRLAERFFREYKQVILVRADLKLPKGKLASQVAHASVDCVLKSPRRKVMGWRRQGMKKIVLKVEGLRELREFHSLAIETGLVCSLITDAGYTTVEPGTVTCLGIGPDISKKIDGLTQNLKMM